MRVSFNVQDSTDLDDVCESLEILAEAVVESMARECDKDKEKFPCCIKCGGFSVSGAPWLPVPGCPPAPREGRTLHMRSAGEILRSGCGTSFDLACYQAAQKRIRGDDPGAYVIIGESDDGDGYEAAVQLSDQHKKPEKRNTVDRPIESARAISCECCGKGDA